MSENSIWVRFRLVEVRKLSGSFSQLFIAICFVLTACTSGPQVQYDTPTNVVTCHGELLGFGGDYSEWHPVVKQDAPYSRWASLGSQTQSKVQAAAKLAEQSCQERGAHAVLKEYKFEGSQMAPLFSIAIDEQRVCLRFVCERNAEK